MNKYLDKHDKPRRVFQNFFDDSILFDKSNERWAKKRKHLLVAFYKEKMTPMLKMIIEIVQEHI